MNDKQNSNQQNTEEFLKDLSCLSRKYEIVIDIGGSDGEAVDLFDIGYYDTGPEFRYFYKGDGYLVWEEK